MSIYAPLLWKPIGEQHRYGVQTHAFIAAETAISTYRPNSFQHLPK